MIAFVLADVDTNTDRALLERCAEAATLQNREFGKPPPYGWGIDYLVRVARDRSDVMPGEWPVLLLSHPDVAGALGYHDRTPKGQPYARVFPGLLQDVAKELCGVLTHEIMEAAANPELNRVSVRDDGTLPCNEPADPPETSSYPVKLASGATELVSAWVTPAYFEPPEDLTGLPLAVGDDRIKAPGDVPDGGYQLLYDDAAKQWTRKQNGELSPYRRALADRGWDKLPRVRAAHGHA